MLWLTVLFLVTTVAARPPERRLPSLDDYLYDVDVFYRRTRDAEDDDTPKHEKPRPLRFG